MIERLRLLWRLDQWRAQTVELGGILEQSFPQQWSMEMARNKRLRILLSIEYYAAKLLINDAALRALMSFDFDNLQDSATAGMLLETAGPIITSDVDDARHLRNIIGGILMIDESFLDSNCEWWYCNYLCKLLPQKLLMNNWQA